MSFFTRKLIIHIILPLVVGLAIYIFFRKDTWLHHHLLPEGFRPFIIPQSLLSNFFVFNMPDLCWSYSLSSALFAWRSTGDHHIKYFPLVVLLLVVAAESIQYFFSSAFTFDWLDIAATVLGFWLSYTLNRQYERS